MAIYDFVCQNCGWKFFIEQPISEYDPDRMPTCLHCGFEAERMISQTNFILEGAGWAKDGY